MRALISKGENHFKIVTRQSSSGSSASSSFYQAREN
jgi:hypothetical protein